MVVEEWQRVGHFRNCFEISRKNLLVKNLKRLKLVGSTHCMKKIALNMAVLTLYAHIVDTG